RRRDLRKKRLEYAKARIPEYWIIDPRDEKIIVLRLVGKGYVLHGEFTKGMTASSHLLPGFNVDVTAAFAAQGTTRRKPKGRRGKERAERGALSAPERLCQLPHTIHAFLQGWSMTKCQQAPQHLSMADF